MISSFATSIFSPLAAEICSHDADGHRGHIYDAVQLNRLLLAQILAAAVMQFSSACISCYTFRLIWKKSCKHHDQPSGLHKAPFGRFRLVANLTYHRGPWAPTQTEHSVGCAVAGVEWWWWWWGVGGQEMMHLHVWMHTESPDEWRHL